MPLTILSRKDENTQFKSKNNQAKARVTRWLDNYLMFGHLQPRNLAQ